MLLRRRGFRVDAVKNGRAAIDALSSFRYDLILLDLLMPQVSGYEVLSFLRGTDAEMLDRVVVVTAFPNAFREQLPIAAVVRKPFDISELSTLVEGVVDRTRANGWPQQAAQLDSA